MNNKLGQSVPINRILGATPAEFQELLGFNDNISKRMLYPYLTNSADAKIERLIYSCEVRKSSLTASHAAFFSIQPVHFPDDRFREIVRPGGRRLITLTISRVILALLPYLAFRCPGVYLIQYH